MRRMLTQNNISKIAVFYPPKGAAWSVAQGVCSTLTRMGYGVLDCTATEREWSWVVDQDAVIVMGPEYLWKGLRERYPLWDSLTKPKFGWLHETVTRADYGTNSIAVNGMLPMDELKKFTPRLFTMASQDTAYGMKFLQCGVDTGLFYPRHKIKKYNVLFIGSLYEMRRKFVEKYPEIHSYLTYLHDIESSYQYAIDMGSANVVLNLPSLSNMSTARVFEAMASGAALVTPIMDGPENYSMFEHGKHLFYYKPDENPTDMVRWAITHPTMAADGFTEVWEKHKLEHRLKILLETQ